VPRAGERWQRPMNGVDRRGRRSGAASRERRETTGRRRHESGGGEGSARGKGGARVAASWARGLPNDGKNRPGARNNAGV
jgi:hypothetical protein